MYVVQGQVACKSCRTLNRVDEHFVQEPLGDHYTIADLPIKPLDQMGRTSSLTSFIEVVRGVAPMDQPHNMCRDMASLPPPWGYAGTNVPHHELHVYTQPVGAGFDLVKLVQFPIRCYLPLIKSACPGEIYGLKMAKNQVPRLLQPSVHYIGCRLGGIAITNLSMDTPKKLAKNVVDLQTGFEYIRSQGPVGSDQNQNVQWTEFERNRPKNPIYGW